MKKLLVRASVSSVLTGSALVTSWLACVSWSLDTREGGALAVGLGGLAGFFGLVALLEYLLAIRAARITVQAEMPLLSAACFLQIFPVAIVLGLGGRPLVAGALALAFGLAPVLYFARHLPGRKTDQAKAT